VAAKIEGWKQVLEQNKTGKSDCNIDFPGSVVWGGIEPPTQGFSVMRGMVSCEPI
jgi:hypothetical protein